jgi:hypothetical protein
MTTVRLPVEVALAALVMAAGVSCCPPQVTPVVQRCPDLKVPTRPHFPIQDYKDTWTRDQLLAAYTQTALLAIGWGNACELIILGHNDPKPPKGP